MIVDGPIWRSLYEVHRDEKNVFKLLVFSQVIVTHCYVSVVVPDEAKLCKQEMKLYLEHFSNGCT